MTNRRYAEGGLHGARRNLAFFAVAMATCMAVLDGSIINVAIPTIARDVGVSPSTAIGLLTCYQIAVVAALLPLSSLGEIFGFRTVYLTGLALFTTASVFCAVATSFPLIVAARILQGLGAAGVMSVNIALIRFIYPKNRLGRGIANAALVVAVSSAGGPTVAAGLLLIAPWQFLFLINVPFGIAALVFGMFTLPYTPLGRRPFDLAGAVLNAATFSLLVLGINSLGDAARAPRTIGLLLGFFLCGTVFARRQMTVANPMLPVDLLRKPLFALSVTTSICSFIAQSSAFIVLPFLLEDYFARSVATTGLLISAWPAATAVTSRIAGPLADRFAPGQLGAIGLSVLTAGFVLMATLGSGAGDFAIASRLALCGIGFGLFQPPNNRAMMSSAPLERSGGASGMQSTSRLLGQSIGAALVSVFISLRGVSHVREALWLAAAMAAAGVVTSALRGASMTN